MGMISCPECGTQVSDQNSRCFKCGYVINASKIEAKEEPALVEKTPEELKKESEKDIQSMSVGIMVLVSIFLFGFIVYMMTQISPSTPKTQSNSNLTRAWVDAKYEVQSMLKAPSTAKWPGYNPAFVTSNGPDSYTVRGYVDAQNSFGAMLRTQFNCSVNYSSGGSPTTRCTLSN